MRFDPAFDPRRTEFLTRMVERWGDLEGTFFNQTSKYLYGYIGEDDMRMNPLIRPGSLVMVDPKLRQVKIPGGRTNTSGPFISLSCMVSFVAAGAAAKPERLSWFHIPLSSCAPEVYQYPDEAEVLGQVVGMVMRMGVS